MYFKVVEELVIKRVIFKCFGTNAIWQFLRSVDPAHSIGGMLGETGRRINSADYDNTIY